MITESDRSQDLLGKSTRPRRANGIVHVLRLGGLRPRKSQYFSTGLEVRKNDIPV